MIIIFDIFIIFQWHIKNIILSQFIIYGNIQIHKFLLLIQYWCIFKTARLQIYHSNGCNYFLSNYIVKDIFLRNWIIQNIQVIKNVGKCSSFMRHIMILKWFYFELFMSHFWHWCNQSLTIFHLTHIKTCFFLLFIGNRDFKVSLFTKLFIHNVQSKYLFQITDHFMRSQIFHYVMENYVLVIKCWWKNWVILKYISCYLTKYQ